MIRSLWICFLLVLGLAEGMESPLPLPLPLLEVESFSLQELQRGTRDTELKDVLATTGILTVRVPLRDHRNINTNTGDMHLLSGLCSCNHQLDSKKDKDEKSRTPGRTKMEAIQGGDEHLLSDGLTVRRTIATATMGLHSPLPLPEDDIIQQCAIGAMNKAFVNDMERVRDLVSQAASDAFIPALQRLIDDHHHHHHHHGHNSNGVRKESVSLMKKKNGQSYSTISSIVNDAVNLEHFHVYSKKQPTDEERSSKNSPSSHDVSPARTLEWHTDGGLFLAFLPAKTCESENEDTSFHVRVSTTNSNVNANASTTIPEAGEYQAVFTPDTRHEITVAIMLGAGAEHWLNTSSSDNDNDNESAPSPSLPLRATTHSVYMKPGQTRVWYGMMHLVPGDAIVQTKPYAMTFEELKKTSTGTRTRTASGSGSGSGSGSSRNGYHGHNNGRRYGDDTSNPKDSIIVGCGTDDIQSNDDAINPVDVIQNGDQDHSTPYRRRLQHVGGPDDCNNSGNFYCWLSCLPEDKNSSGDSTTEEHLSAGESLYCLDPSILAQTGNLAKAVEECADSFSGEAGGVMNEACGNYWHHTEAGVQSYLEGNLPTNENTGTGKDATTYEEQYCYGATGMYMQGFEWEGTTCVVYLFSSWILTTRSAFAAACFGTIVFGIMVEFIIRQRRTILGRMERGMKKIMTSAALYGVQLTLGYLLMLVVMTYSGPLVISVVVGLVIGHLIWNWKDVVGENGSGEIVLDGSTPCCQNIIEEEGEQKSEKIKEKSISSSKTKEGTCCGVSLGSDEENC